MSFVYGGNQAGIQNVNWPGGISTVNVSGATNATPIEITTTVAHGFQTGDRVIVASVGGNTAANSPGNIPWTITVTGTNKFTLTGSVGNGAYTSGGAAYDISLGPALTMPSDGDAFSVASVNVSLQALADRTQALGKILSPLSATTGQLIAQYVGGTSDDTWTSWSTAATGTGNWSQIANMSTLLALSAAGVRYNHGDFFTIGFSAGEMTASGTLAVALSASFACQTVGPNGIGFALTGCAQKFLASYDNAVNLQAQVVAQSTGQTANIATLTGGKLTITGLSGLIPSVANGATITIWGAASAANNGTFLVTDWVSSTSLKILDHTGSVTGDANNGSIRWRIDQAPFDMSVIVQGVVGTPTYNMLGHRQIVVSHYRPNALYTLGGPP